MKIQIGEVYMDKVHDTPTLYPNKTRKYILPCLKEYGEIFTNRLNNVFKVAVGIGDVIVDRTEVKYERHVFLLLNSKIASQYFLEFLEWVRDQPMYEDDYVYDNIQRSSFHMVIVKLPEKFYNSFETFKGGEYSKMFNEETISQLFNNHPDVKKVLIRSHEYKIVFVRRINRRFGTNLSPEEFDGEFEFRPTAETEVFNHHLMK